MGDFLLDLREPSERQISVELARRLLKFSPETNIEVIERPGFSVSLGRVDSRQLWAPALYEGVGGEVMVALAGRIALDDEDWKVAESLEGTGGLACKWICHQYAESGCEALKNLNGNYAVILFDESRHMLHLVTDRCGMTMSYASNEAGHGLAFSSHADVLAKVLGEEERWDTTSVAQFVMTGSLSYPYTYYANIRALRPGTIYSFSVRDQAGFRSETPYFEFKFKADGIVSEEALADELGGALKKAVRRRTHPRFGLTGVALSGGLDSRAILQAAGSGENIQAFSLCDNENSEIRIAERIANQMRVKLDLVSRDAEFYGRSAELGVRISGGGGSMASNHFLGARASLFETGFENLVTGCYCDYIFKALALNTSERGLARWQSIGKFELQFYRPHYRISEEHAEAVLERLGRMFPETKHSTLSENDWFHIEQKRVFPLAYEGDCAQRLIPQRVLPWYPILVDNDLINVYQRIPFRMKLNNSIFRKMLRTVCPEAVLRIKDANTGAPINASVPRLIFSRYYSALLNRLARASHSSGRGSWPNREHYVRHSPVVQRLWRKPNKEKEDFLRELLGPAYRTSPSEYHGRDAQLGFRVLTMKLWLDQRCQPVKEEEQAMAVC